MFFAFLFAMLPGPVPTPAQEKEITAQLKRLEHPRYAVREAAQRALGEFGSVVLVAGNVPNETLTAPVFIFQLANQFRPVEAAAVATLLFAISFVLVLVTGRLLRRKEED